MGHGVAPLVLCGRPRQGRVHPGPTRDSSLLVRAPPWPDARATGGNDGQRVPVSWLSAWHGTTFWSAVTVQPGKTLCQSSWYSAGNSATIPTQWRVSSAVHPLARIFFPENAPPGFPPGAKTSIGLVESFDDLATRVIMVAMNEDRREPLSEQLRQLVRESGESLRQLAEGTGLHKSALSRFLSGERGASTEGWDALGRHLGLKLVRAKRGPKRGRRKEP